MKKTFISCLLAMFMLSCSHKETVVEGKSETFCNPMNLNYRFQFSRNNSYREAADPAMIIYKGKYILFVSHSGGYWYSDDMLKWNYLPVSTLPIEDYAPDAIAINDTVYYIASAGTIKPFYFSTNPFQDNWQQAPETLPFDVWDPHYFKDDDGKIYLYWGCSDTQPIYGIQLNSKMQAIGKPVVLISHNPENYGWEIPGEYNELDRNGWNEGPWMTKYNNRYYLQYAAPGTEFKTYADGIYTSDSPLASFKYETYSPFSYKPGGFIGGAGHSSTFQDKYGNYWHVSSMSISVRHMFERRLGLFPVAFDKDGVMRTFTAFGDYPTIMPDRKIDFENEDLFKGWMLLSFNKKSEASSSMDEFPVTNAFDEDIRTWWSANTGNAGEWLSVELDDNSTVNAIQINFADNESKLQPDSKDIFYCYRVLASDDGQKWKVIVDKSNNTQDAVHDYIELEKPVKTKYIKIENVKVPDGKFSVYGLRIFGLREGEKPARVNELNVRRDEADTRKALVTWPEDKNATGYIVNYGIAEDKLYTPVMIYGANSVMLTGLNKGIKYYYSIDTFNESGITKGTKVVVN